MTSRLKPLFSAPDDQLSPTEYRQYLLLTLLAPFGAFTLAFFTYYNAVVLDRMGIAIVAGLTAIVFIGAFLMRSVKNFKTANAVILTALALDLLVFNYLNQNQGFGLIWTTLFPVLAIVISGRRLGTLFSLLVYSATLYIIIPGLGTWQGGLWDITGLLRFSFAYLLLTALFYLLDISGETSYEKLNSLHQKQLEHAQQLKQMAITDSLTGLFNRYHLNHEGKRLLNAMQLSDSTLVFFLMDLDWFKAYNDHHGHQKGDTALCKAGHLLKQEVELLGGTAYRIGGEEFACMIMTDDLNATLADVKQFPSKLEGLNIGHESSKYDVLTCSLGILLASRHSTLIFEHLYRTADQALYQAKRNGRNTSVVKDIRHPIA